MKSGSGIPIARYYYAMMEAMLRRTYVHIEELRLCLNSPTKDD